MPKRLIGPKINRLFRSHVEGLITDLSKRNTVVAVLMANVAQCPNCKWDNSTQSSSGQYNGTGPTPFVGHVCPVCNGKGKVQDVDYKTVEAIVTWGKPMESKPNIVVAGGELKEGHARIKSKIIHKPTMEAAEYFIVDGIRCSKMSPVNGRGLLDQAVAEIVVERDD